MSILTCAMPFAHAESDTAAAGQIARGFFALPVEIDFDSGAANGDATIMRIQPLYTFPVFDKWRLIHLDVITVADAPSGLPEFPGAPPGSSGARDFGISDLLHTTLFTPKSNGNTIWGIGVNLGIPTATDDSLGSGKWAAGPAFRFVYRTELWNVGWIVGQRWSFAGSSNRSDVNQLLIRGAIRRQLGDDWYLVSAPLITSNWGLSGEKWTVPVGGGIGRRFDIGRYPWAWSVQGYYNVIKPEPAPDWVFRFAIVAAIPFGK